MTATRTATNSGTHGKPPGPERRRAPRYCCLGECHVRLEGAAEPSDWSGMVYNISAGGVGLALPFPALPGMVLHIEPRRRQPGGMSVRARVLRCGLREYVWFHGCEFVTRLGEEELRDWLAALRGKRAPQG